MSQITAEAQKLEQLIPEETRPLLTLRSAFPFDLFPDVISLDRQKVNINKRFFFFTRQVHSFALKDIMTVIMETSVFFASIKIVDRFFPQDTISIEYLPKDGAIEFRRVIDGLMAAAREGIELEKIPNNELLPRVRELGRSHVQN